MTTGLGGGIKDTSAWRAWLGVIGGDEFRDWGSWFQSAGRWSLIQFSISKLLRWSSLLRLTGRDEIMTESSLSEHSHSSSTSQESDSTLICRDSDFDLISTDSATWFSSWFLASSFSTQTDADLDWQSSAGESEELTSGAGGFSLTIVSESETRVFFRFQVELFWLLSWSLDGSEESTLAFFWLGLIPSRAFLR